MKMIHISEENYATDFDLSWTGDGGEILVKDWVTTPHLPHGHQVCNIVLPVYPRHCVLTP